ncbi:MAG TPA: STAS domain-containing protein [Spirochaetota bacterium]|nr:STAS domain-containing protein [Spirochaetota bacterium]HNT10041.1 STAS domain-containing protein [Spirochaetota bacterium]HNV47779.1 STAS domain-containing protein [Spirochaetota bacterium]HOS39652.1 STAS domain-containing protein [Spirochaetota bacterium]HPI23595.1 STAS domain-containing protein [Spirochaetota bacterium]
MDLHIRRAGEHAILDIIGNAHLYTINSLNKALLGLIEERESSIVVDARNIEFFDSSFLASLLMAKKKVEAYNGRIALMNINEPLQRLLEIANMDKRFRIYESEEHLVQ